MKYGLLAVVAFTVAARVSASEVYNLTDFPAYPNLSTAKMDDVARTDKLGHWCNRFAGTTFDSLEAVEVWYRNKLVAASETDLNNDERYKRSEKISGIKLAMGIDYVTVYRLAHQSVTTIELFKCSPPAVGRSTIRDHVEFLESEAMNGRCSRTRDEDITVTDIAAQLRRSGLHPASDDGDGDCARSVEIARTDVAEGAVLIPIWAQGGRPE